MKNVVTSLYHKQIALQSAKAIYNNSSNFSFKYWRTFISRLTEFEKATSVKCDWQSVKAKWINRYNKDDHTYGN